MRNWTIGTMQRKEYCERCPRVKIAQMEDIEWISYADKP